MGIPSKASDVNERWNDSNGTAPSSCDLDLLPERTCRELSVLTLFKACCKYCYNSVCSMQEDLVHAALDVWSLAPGTCRPALVASAIVLLQLTTQFHEQAAADLDHMEEASELDVRPFPFSAELVKLYREHVPAYHHGSCTESHSIEHHAENLVLVPRKADLTQVRCPVVFDDLHLVRRCRNRRLDAVIIRPPNGMGPAQVSHAQHSQPNWKCPTNVTFVTTKYENQPFRSCASGHGTWGARIEGHLKCVAVTVAERLHIRPGESVLDWGSGCGWTLSWLHTLYGAQGYGIEATVSNFDWTRRFSTGRVCYWHSTDLSWVPDGEFDVIISYWALYHLRSSSQQCALARQLITKLKPGGRAWFGGNVPSPALNIAHTVFTQKQWQRCLQGLAKSHKLTLSVEFVSDLAMFRADTADFGTLRGDYLFWQPTFSVLVDRLQ